MPQTSTASDIRSRRLKTALKVVFFIALTVSLYFAATVIRHLNHNNDQIRQQIEQVNTAQAVELQQRLNRLRVDFEHLVHGLNNHPQTTHQQAMKALARQQKLTPLVSHFDLVWGGQADSDCQAQTTHWQWQSRMDIDNHPDNPLLVYQFNADNPEGIRCLRLYLEVDDIVHTFYRHHQWDRFHLVLDDDNRVIYHPDSTLVGRNVMELISLEPVMALAGHRPPPQKTDRGWHVQGHHSDMEQQQWSVSSLFHQSDKAQFETLTRKKQQAIADLSLELDLTKRWLVDQLQNGQADPGLLLSELRRASHDSPLLDSFYFTMENPNSSKANCYFDTQNDLSIHLGRHRQCRTSQDASPGRMGKWSVSANPAAATLRYKLLLSNQKPYQTVGFTLNVDQLVHQVELITGHHLQHFVLDKTGKVVNNKQFSDLSDHDGNTPLQQMLGGHDTIVKQGPRKPHYGPPPFDRARYMYKQNTGQSLWVQNHPMDDRSWQLVTISESPMTGAAKGQVNHPWLHLVLATLICLISYLCLVLRVYDGDLREYWQSVTLFTTLSVMTIAVVWYIQLSMPGNPNAGAFPIRDDTSLAHSLDLDKHFYFKGQDLDEVADPPNVALGVRVDTMSFTDQGKLKLVGLVWLKNVDCSWPKKSKNCVDLDKVRLEIPTAESLDMSVYSKEPGSVTWRFTMDIDFPLSAAVYPFERGIIPIRFTSAGYNNSYRLVPDLSAYGMMNPQTKPGLAEDLDLPGWQLFSSYFTYQGWLNTAKYNNGDPLYDGQLTELYYNIEAGRRFLNPFIADMVPIIVITALLFLVLMTMTRDEQKMNELGFNASAMLGYCSGLFFVLIVAHVYLREKLDIDTIAYIEYFYFTMYFVILSLSAAALLFTSRFAQARAVARDGVMLKLLFWPVIFVVILTFTFITFYRI